VKKYGYSRVGILCPNTPAFLESIFAIAAAGAVNVGMDRKSTAFKTLELKNLRPRNQSSVKI
jgi:acyl-CoA synthetase (AMP-forming)/AMP-acid ligase II